MVFQFVYVLSLLKLRLNSIFKFAILLLPPIRYHLPYLQNDDHESDRGQYPHEIPEVMVVESDEVSSVVPEGDGVLVGAVGGVEDGDESLGQDVVVLHGPEADHLYGVDVLEDVARLVEVGHEDGAVVDVERCWWRIRYEEILSGICK